MKLEESRIYQTLYSEQRPFIDNLVNNKHFLDEGRLTRKSVPSEWATVVTDSKSVIGIPPTHVCQNRYGFFLKMGFGKTKLLCCMAELQESDLVIVTTELSKVLERNKPGSFTAELTLAGYECWYQDEVLYDKKIRQDFYDALHIGKKIAYFTHWKGLCSKANFGMLNWIVGGHWSLHKDLQAEAKLIDPNYGIGYRNICWIMDEVQAVNHSTSKGFTTVYDFLENTKLLSIHLNRYNYFKDRIRGVYMGSGTPMTGKLLGNFFPLLQILGHKWGKSYTMEDTLVCEEYTLVKEPKPHYQYVLVNSEVPNAEVLQCKNEYDYFFERYCVEDTSVKRFNVYARAVKDYKRINELQAIINEYGCFGETKNYFKLPELHTQLIFSKPCQAYLDLLDKSNDDIESHTIYRVYKDWICDTPSLLYLRSRQMCTGIIGSNERFDVVDTTRHDLLANLLKNIQEDAIIFYNWTPELYLIIDAVESAGYTYDIYNGFIKNLDNYYSTEKTDKKNVIIANIASGSKALNLQKYRNVIFFSMTTVYADFEQGIGRAYRLGQLADIVNIYCFIAKGSIEERVYNSVSIGKDYTEKVFSQDFLLTNHNKNIVKEQGTT